jgi:Kef-type K+ transport system membrane component KefB
MDPAEFILSLALILLFAKVLGEIAQKFKLPGLLGEVIAGVLLGPAVLGFVHVSEAFHFIAEIGIIMLIFMAGFEHGNIKELLKYKNTSILISALSSTLPVIAVVLLAMNVYDFSLVTSLFLAVALGATSMGVALRSLISVDQIDTKVGKTVIGSLVLNDITGLILLTVAVTYGDIATGGSANILFAVGKSVLSVLLCFILFYFGFKIIPKLTYKFINFKVEEAEFTFALIIVLLASWVASYLGLSSIIGAFVAGMILSRSPVFETRNFHQKIFSISYGFFVPVFFTLIGVQIVFDNFWSNLARALIFFVIITAIQVFFAAMASRINKYSVKESLFIGISMLPYGEVSLIVMSSLLTLSAANEAFFIGQDLTGLFSSVLLLIVLTVVANPLLMKLTNKVIKDGRR